MRRWNCLGFPHPRQDSATHLPSLEARLNRGISFIKAPRYVGMNEIGLGTQDVIDDGWAVMSSTPQQNSGIAWLLHWRE